MRRLGYGLLCLTVIICSVGAGLMTYTAAIEREEQTKIKEAVIKQLENQKWYLPLGDTYGWLTMVDEDEKVFLGQTKDGRQVLINCRGKLLKRLREDMQILDSVGGGMLVYQDADGKQGYVDYQGNVKIPARFVTAHEFQDGYAVVETETKNSKQKIEAPIDSKGNILYDTEESDKWPEWYSEVEQIRGKYFFLRLRTYANPQRIFDAEKGEIVKELEDERNGQHIFGLGEKRYAFSCYDDAGNDQYFLMDENFDLISEEVSYKWVNRFSEGLCYAKWTENGKECSGYIDRNGKIRIRLTSVLYGGKFSEGKAMIWEKDKVHVIDKEGRRLFEKTLTVPLDESLFEDMSYYDFENNYDVSGCWYRDGSAVYFDGKKFGIIDDEGDWIIEPVFDFIEFAGADMILMKIDGKTGIMKAGEMYD
ncbi:WG repeat-containing protein [Ihubacter sp. rT4E-8]|uniref:WG repeat-containing protein n=1 Tax=unclassified Ihubacter TaxID=2633299 RepID=UPI0013796B81